MNKILFYLSFLILFFTKSYSQAPTPIHTVAACYYSDPAFNILNTQYKIQYSQNGYGPNFINNTNGYRFQGKLVLGTSTPGTNDLAGCSSYPPLQPDGSSWNNTIVVVIKGNGCLTFDKVLQAQFAGAIGVIIILNDPNGYRTPGWMPKDSSGNSPDPKIPSATITYSDGMMILDMIKNYSNTYIADIPGTGPLVDPNELIAVKALSKTMKVINSYDMKYTLPIQDWNGTDPCVGPRISLIKCIEGHIVELDACGIPYIGYFPPQLNYLTELRKFSFVGGVIMGGFPDIRNLSKLELFSISDLSNGAYISNLPDFTYHPNMQVIYFIGHKLTAIPAAITNLTKLSILVLTNNNLQTFPQLNSKSLLWLDVSNNKINSPLPNFSNSSLVQFSLAGNKFYSYNATNNFDNMKSIISVNLGNNQISGPLPEFNNCPYITSLVLSKNDFQGPFPESYNKLMNLQILDAAYNKLTGPFNFVATKLQNLLVKNNLINPMNDFNNTDVSTWSVIFNKKIPSTIVSMDFSNNRFTGNWDYSNLDGTKPNLQILILKNNSITTLPPTLFTIGFRVFDVSYNKISGAIPSATSNPQSKIEFLDFSNNPLMVATNGNLPAFVEPDPSKPYVEYGRFSCPTLRGKSDWPFLNFYIDPSYYKYNTKYSDNCRCGRGFYGDLPDCLDIPFEVNLKNQTFSDQPYGSLRQMQGIDITWVITKENTQVVNFEINTLPDFLVQANEYINKIRISDSCPVSKSINPLNKNCSCTMGTVFSMLTQKCEFIDQDSVTYNQKFYDITPNPLQDKYSIKVISPISTFSFQSKKMYGSHFLANISFETDCPENYKIFRYIKNDYFVSEKCEKIFTASKSIQVAAFIIIAVITALIGSITILIYRKRNTLIIRSASFPFCFMMLIFMIILSCSSIFYVLQPDQLSEVCIIRQWLTGLPLVGVLSALLVKANRIRRIFASKELVVQTITNTDLLKNAGVILFGETILLIIFSSLKLSYAEYIYGTGFISNLIYKSCNLENYYNIWLGIQFAYVAIFLFAGIVIAWQVRSVPSAFNEAPHIASCFLSLAVLLVILIPVNYLVDDNPNALIIIRGLGQALVTIVMCFFLFGPKIYYIIEGKENDKHLSSISASSSSSSSSSSFSSSK